MLHHTYGLTKSVLVTYPNYRIFELIDRKPTIYNPYKIFSDFVMALVIGFKRIRVSNHTLITSGIGG